MPVEAFSRRDCLTPKISVGEAKTRAGNVNRPLRHIEPLCKRRTDSRIVKVQMGKLIVELFNYIFAGDAEFIDLFSTLCSMDAIRDKNSRQDGQGDGYPNHPPPKGARQWFDLNWTYSPVAESGKNIIFATSGHLVYVALAVA